MRSSAASRSACSATTTSTARPRWRCSRAICRRSAARPSIDVPDRLLEGYGPNPQALERLAAQGCRLVVTLDCGTTAFEALALAAERGLEVIVVDHHAAEPRLPQALAVINPNRCDQVSPARDLAAVGVTFLVVVALNRALRARGHFARRGRARSAPLARSGGARHGVRRGAAHRASIARWSPRG